MIKRTENYEFNKYSFSLCVKQEKDEASRIYHD